MEWTKAVAFAVLFALIVLVPQSVSADWMDEWIEREMKRNFTSSEARLTAIDTEIQEILSEMIAISEKYRAFAQELGYITPLNWRSACAKLRALRPGKDIARVQNQASRVIELIRVANGLVDRGGIPPKRLKEILLDRDFPLVMERSIHDVKELEDKCK